MLQNGSMWQIYRNGHSLSPGPPPPLCRGRTRMFHIHWPGLETNPRLLKCKTTYFLQNSLTGLTQALLGQAPKGKTPSLADIHIAGCPSTAQKTPPLGAALTLAQQRVAGFKGALSKSCFSLELRGAGRRPGSCGWRASSWGLQSTSSFAGLLV